MKNNKGKLLVSIVLVILILIFIAFLLYEIFYVDIFNIMTQEASIIDVNETENRPEIAKNEISNILSENIEIVEPIINNSNNLRR